MNPIKTVSTAELSKSLNNPQIKIIDVRPVEAYNGWQLQGEKRGGHIQSAKSLPFKWTNYMDWIEVVRSKKILPIQKIIIYGYSEEEWEKVAQLFQKARYPDVFIYVSFLSEWVIDEALPME